MTRGEQEVYYLWLVFEEAELGVMVVYYGTGWVELTTEVGIKSLVF